MGCNTSKPLNTGDGEYLHSRSDTPSIYSRQAHVRATPSHSRNNSDDMKTFRTCEYEYRPPSAFSSTRPLLETTSQRSYVQPTRRPLPDVSDVSSTALFARFSTAHRYPSMEGTSGQRTRDPHRAFRDNPRSSEDSQLPLCAAPSASNLRPRVPDPSGPRFNHRPCTDCGFQRQRGQPCFVCLRTRPKPLPKPTSSSSSSPSFSPSRTQPKPKARRYKSRRKAQVLIPRASYYGRTSERDRESDGESWRARSLGNERGTEKEVETRPVARQGMFVPKRMASQLSETIGGHENEALYNRDRNLPRDSSPPRTDGTDSSGCSIIGRYALSPEAYYSSLPLPDLPKEAYQQWYRMEGNERVRRIPAWI